MTQIRDLAQLRAHVQLWQNPPADAPIGYMLSLEGADSILTPGHLERAYEQGCERSVRRTTGPARMPRARTPPAASACEGASCWQRCERLGIILDATHLCDDSFWEAIDHFHGPVWASHNNCRALVPTRGSSPTSRSRR